MTALLERPVSGVTRMPTRSHFVEWTVGAAGAVAAAVGAWMYYVPADWVLGGLAEGWFLGVFIGAGMLLATAFGLFARKGYLAASGWTVGVTVATLLALAAVGGAIAFALILLI
jgi:hypothetical protein